MNARILIALALVAVASARPQGVQDDVFHFSSNNQNLVRSSVVQPQTVVVKSVKSVQSVPVVQQQVHHVVEQHEPSVLFRSVEQEVPAFSSVHHHHVQQPVYSQFSSSRLFNQQVNPSFLSTRSYTGLPSVQQYSKQYTSQVNPSVLSTRTFSSSSLPAVQQYSNQYSNQYASQVNPSILSTRTFSSLPASQQFSNQYSNQYSSQFTAEPKFKILKQDQEIDPSGLYHFNFETENGIASVEQGTVKDINDKEGPVAAKEGSYSYTGPDGVQYTVNWVADELGFRASGAHLPQAPEVPAEIQRSLDLIASQPQKYDEDGNPLPQLNVRSQL